MIFRGKACSLLSFLVMGLLPFSCFAQQYDTASKFSQPVSLDSFVVKSSFDVNAFIRRVRSDTTFYKAFKNLRFIGYDAVNSIEAFGNSGQRIASLHSKTQQQVDGKCRKTKIIEEQSTGNFYKHNGDYNYYTAELFAYLFFAKDTICNENDIVTGSLNEKGSGTMARSDYELRQLIFNPGARVSGVPFMGDRASIFDEGEAKKYDFKISLETYNGYECYVFRITPKKGYEHQALFNELTTWFRKIDYSIVARNYALSYHTLLYDFDVRMQVRTRQTGSKLYPTHIDYNGNWHVFTKKRERVKFTVDISY